MVGSETPKIRETSLRSIPRSQAASILSLRSFEYGFMTRVSHTDQPSRKPLSEAPSVSMSSVDWLEWIRAVASVMTALGVIFTSIGVFLAWRQILFTKKQAIVQFEDSLAREYREIMQELPVGAWLGE